MMTHTGGATVLSTRRLKEKKMFKKKTTKKPIPCHTQPPLYCATLCFLSSLCVSCVKQRKTLLEAVLTPGTGTRVFSFFLCINVW